jgi:excisionase family DNA binding protein
MATAPKLGIVQPGDPTMASISRAARELPTEQLPEFIGQLEAAKDTAWARLTAPAPVTQQHDELLDVAAAAERLGVSKDYLYRHHAKLPFARREGRRLLFSALGIDKYIRQQKT